MTLNFQELTLIQTALFNQIEAYEEKQNDLDPENEDDLESHIDFQTKIDQLQELQTKINSLR